MVMVTIWHCQVMDWDFDDSLRSGNVKTHWPGIVESAKATEKRAKEMRNHRIETNVPVVEDFVPHQMGAADRGRLAERYQWGSTANVFWCVRPYILHTLNCLRSLLVTPRTWSVWLY